MVNRIAVLMFALLCFGVIASGSSVAGASAPTKKAGALPRWRIDPARSRLQFAAAMNGQGFNGQFRRWTADIRFDPVNLKDSSVRVVVDMRSAATGDVTRDEALPTADWFATTLFPRATFTSRRFVDLGGSRYRVDGDLMIRNVARPVSFPFHLAIKGSAATMQGRLSLDRTLFGVGQGQFRGTETVAGKVDVIISLSASQAS